MFKVVTLLHIGSYSQYKIKNTGRHSRPLSHPPFHRSIDQLIHLLYIYTTRPKNLDIAKIPATKETPKCHVSVCFCFVVGFLASSFVLKLLPLPKENLSVYPWLSIHA